MSKTPRTDEQILHHANGNWHPSAFVLASFARQLETELAEARAEIERLALEIENKQYTITCASEENQQLKESLAEARTEIERLNKKLRLLLCEEHFEKCERGLFNSENPDDEPCLICLMDAAERGE